MKTIKKIWVASIWYMMLLTITTVSAQQVRDFTLSGAVSNGNYEGYGIAATIDATLTIGADASNSMLAPGSISVVIKLPTGMSFRTFTAPSGWTSSSNTTDNSVTLTQNATFSPVPPASIIPLSIPINLDGPVTNGQWSIELEINDPAQIDDPNQDNNKSIGSVNVQNKPLPVKLASFKAYNQEGHAFTSWITTEEVDFGGFEVQRSISSKGKFEPIAFLKSKGANGLGNTYEFVDLKAPKGQMLYYRLKMIDIDGNFEYSTIQSLELEGENNSVYPNPAKNHANISLHEGIRSLKLYNLLGQEISKNAYTGNNRLETIDLHNTPAGVYQVRIEGVNGAVIFRKLVVGE